MVDKDTLKEMLFLNDLPGPVFDKIAGLATIETYDPGTVMFYRNQELTHLFMLVSGKIHLNFESAAGKFLILDKVYPGRTFGISALMTDTASAFSATCAEKSTIISIPGHQMKKLFEQDFKIGHILMLKVVKLLKSRMEMHTRQFLLSLSMHPEIKLL
jgi:CRP-like cAMP-binding protein